MREPSTKILICALSIALIGVTTPIAHAQVAPPTGTPTSVEATQLYTTGQYEAAAQRFMADYQATGRVELLFSTFLARYEAGNLPGAVEVLRQYVSQRNLPAYAPQSRRLQEVEQELAASGGLSSPMLTLTVGSPASSGGSGIGPMGIVGMTGIGVGALALGLSAVTGVLTLDQEAALLERCPGRVCADESYRHDRDNGITLTIATDTLLISGLVLVGAGVTLLVMGLSGTDGSDDTLAYGLGCDGQACLGTVGGNF